MKIEKKSAYNFRIYPTEEQEIFFSKQFGCCRFIYNNLLHYRSTQYKEHSKNVSGYEAKKRIAILKLNPLYAWLKEVNSQSLQESALDLEKAYKGFFQKKRGYPRYKKKFSRQSCTIPQHFRISTSQKGNCYLSIPKLKSMIRVVAHREIKGVVKRITIVKTPAGNYYARFMSIEEIEVKGKQAEGTIGLDVGLKHLVTTSYGDKIDPLKLLSIHDKKMIRLSRLLSRKLKGGKNRSKARIQIARLHERISNTRKDFLHKLSRILVDENQIIRIEDLNIMGLLKNRRLSRSIMDASWGMFFNMLEYKAYWLGKQVEKAGRFVATSKLCSKCGNKNNALTLKDRIWTCKVCGVTHDRDVNAAKNIKQLGQGMPEVTPMKRTTSTFLTKEKQVGS